MSDPDLELVFRPYKSFRIGNGIDVHALVQNRDLVIGGIKIDHDLGSDGHSDGDVLIHSIMDAILGAINKGDIGDHFPSSDNSFKGANSLELLRTLYNKYLKSQWDIVNIDSTIVLQNPPIKPYVESMINKITSVLSIEASQLTIKATTTDHLGFIGKEEGIAAFTVCMLCK